MSPREGLDQTTRHRLRMWLRYYLRRRSWTHERMATELELATSTITNIVNGKRGAGMDVMLRMHRKLNASADDLLDTLPRDRRPADPYAKDPEEEP